MQQIISSISWTSAVACIFASVALSLSNQQFKDYSPGAYASTAIYALASLIYGHVYLKKEYRSNPKLQISNPKPSNAFRGALRPMEMFVALLHVLGIWLPSLTHNEDHLMLYLQMKQTAIPVLLVLLYKLYISSNAQKSNKVIWASLMMSSLAGFVYFWTSLNSTAYAGYFSSPDLETAAETTTSMQKEVTDHINTDLLVRTSCLGVIAALIFAIKFTAISQQLGVANNEKPNSSSPIKLFLNLCPGIFVFSLLVSFASGEVSVTESLESLMNSDSGFSFYVVSSLVIMAQSVVWFYMVLNSVVIVQHYGPFYSVFFSQCPQLFVLAVTRWQYGLDLAFTTVFGLLCSAVAFIVFLVKQSRDSVNKTYEKGLPTMSTEL